MVDDGTGMILKWDIRHLTKSTRCRSYSECQGACEEKHLYLGWSFKSEDINWVNMFTGGSAGIHDLHLRADSSHCSTSFIIIYFWLCLADWSDSINSKFEITIGALWRWGVASLYSLVWLVSRRVSKWCFLSILFLLFCFLTITYSFLISPSHPHRHRHHRHPERAWILNSAQWKPFSACLSFINIGGWVFHLPVGEGGGRLGLQGGGIAAYGEQVVGPWLTCSMIHAFLALFWWMRGKALFSAAQGGNTPTGSVKALSHAVKWSQAWKSLSPNPCVPGRQKMQLNVVRYTIQHQKNRESKLKFCGTLMTDSSSNWMLTKELTEGREKRLKDN